MRNAAAKLGTLAFTPEDHQKIEHLKGTAEANPVGEEETLPDSRRAVVCGIEIAWFLMVDREDGIGQYRLFIKGDGCQPDLDVVQAMSVPFFGTNPYEIMPYPKDRCVIRVSSLFFPYES
ncbi:MAG: hypothetical protein HY201_02835 [Nitrospirae bacterium]|nr:hypothetical protein [Candidatus Troglogloeales bacterium]